MQILRKCRTHGDTTFVSAGQGVHKRMRCLECRKEAVVRKRKKLKDDSLAYKGGKCQFCGYNRCNKALEFHHTDPKEKDFTLGDGNTRSFEKVKIELDKCILLCSNCHREEHDRLLLED